MTVTESLRKKYEKTVKKALKEKFGYDLIAEIRYIGTPTQEEAEIWKNFTVH